MVILCMGDHQSHKYAIERLKEVDYRGFIAATGKYDDDVRKLREAGVDSAYNFYTEAGIGFANHVCERLCASPPEGEVKDH